VIDNNIPTLSYSEQAEKKSSRLFIMSQLERIYHFHNWVLNKRYPNATTVADHFEVSQATAHRDITYLRERLLAPLDFDRTRNGYYYTEDGFTLPFENSPQIVFMFAMLHKMADEAGLGALPEVQFLKEQLGRLLFSDHKRLVDSIHCEWIEVESVDPKVLEVLLSAVQDRVLVKIGYVTPAGKTSTRIIEPMKIINYQGRWYVMAFCRLRQQVRIFHSARISNIQSLEKNFNPHQLDIDGLLTRSFGIFKGDGHSEAKILFTGEAAAIVREQRWHASQKIENTEEGVILTLPFSDFTELKMKILQFGSRARVLAPSGLRDAVAEEIRKMYLIANTPCAME